MAGEAAILGHQLRSRPGGNPVKWTVLCVSNDAASRLLYQSMLELDGLCILVAADINGAVKVTEGIAIDCVVVDCEDNGISVTREIASARRGVPILLVSDRSEVQLQVYAEIGMIVSKEEAIEQLSKCIGELIARSVRPCENDRRKLGRTSSVRFFGDKKSRSKRMLVTGPLVDTVVRHILALRSSARRNSRTATNDVPSRMPPDGDIPT